MSQKIHKALHSTYDVVVSGAGMVGLVTALSLSKQHDKVLLIEQGEKPTWEAEEPRQLRVSAMAEKHWQWFDELGMSGHFNHMRLGPYRHMSVWDNRSDAELDFTQEGSNNLGAIVENGHVIAAAMSAVEMQHNLDVRFQIALDHFEDVGRKVRLTLSDGSEVNTSLLISAEGAHSPTRKAAAIDVKQSGYGQQGIVCYVKLDKAAADTAFQAFNPTGPVGILPVGGGLFSIVWSLSDDQVKTWLDCDEQKFCHGLKAHINRDLGMPELRSKRVAFPLRKLQAAHYVKGRVVLLGDAAHVVHPLAGQGVNLGLSDASLLSKKLASVSLKDTETLTQALKKYQRIRKSKVAESMLIIDALHHLFTLQRAPIPMFRSLGMNAVNRLNPLKSWFISQAGS